MFNLLLQPVEEVSRRQDTNRDNDQDNEKALCQSWKDFSLFFTTKL